MADPMAPGLCKLPVELRMEIYQYLLEPDQVLLAKIPIITDRSPLTVQASQPAVSLVNRQMREESLDVFYGSNTFVLRLFDIADLDSMSQYFKLIGEHRVEKLRCLSLCSWAKLGFGHMLFKWWWRVDINLKDGTAVWDRDITWSDELRLMESFKKSFKSRFDAKHGSAWTTDELIEIMRVFVLTCTAY